MWKISENHSLSLYLFKDVKNMNDVRKNVFSGSFGRSLALLDAECIYGVDHVLIATNKACFNKMKTKDIHTEIIFNLGVSKHISNALPLFGCKDDNSVVLVGGINMSGNDEKNLRSLVKGEELKVSENISKFRNLDKLKKIFKIKQGENNVSLIGKLILSKIACRDV